MRAVAIVGFALVAAAAYGQIATPEPIIEGLVLSRGLPVAGAKVSLDSEGDSQSIETRPGGGYHFSLYSGRNNLVEVSHSGEGEQSRSFRRIRARLRPETNSFRKLDVELQPGTGVLEGRITRNGQGAMDAAVTLRWTANDLEYAVCAMTNEDGSYRIEGIPAGTYRAEINAYPTSFVLAVNRLRQEIDEREVSISANMPQRCDFDLQVGDICVLRPNLGAEESARLVVVPGSFSGKRMTLSLAERLLRNAAAARDIAPEDDSICMRDLRTGNYVVFCGIFSGAPRNVEQAFRAMRIVYGNVTVTANETADLKLSPK